MKGICLHQGLTKFVYVISGSGSYKPTGASGGGDSQGPTNAFFPQKDFITFDQANPTAIIGKFALKFRQRINKQTTKITLYKINQLGLI